MNIKNTIDIVEENHHHLYIACEASTGNFVVPNFWFLFWNCLEKWIHLFLPERFANFWGFDRWCPQNHETLCSVHRRYPTILIFSEILLLCYMRKIISYNFTRLAVFYLKLLYSKTLDDAMMNRSWPIFV